MQIDMEKSRRVGDKFENKRANLVQFFVLFIILLDLSQNDLRKSINFFYLILDTINVFYIFFSLKGDVHTVFNKYMKTPSLK